MESCINNRVVYPLKVSGQSVDDQVEVMIDGVVDAMVKRYLNLDMYIEECADECIMTINDFGIGEKKKALFQLSYKTGAFLNDLKDKARDYDVPWTSIRERVERETGLRERSLQMYMRVAQRDDVDEDLSSKSFSYVYDYVVGLEDIDLDKILSLDEVVNSIAFDEKNSKDRKRVARKAACKLLVRNSSANIDPNILDEIDILIDSSGEITRDLFRKLIKEYVAQDANKRSEYVKNFVATSSSIMKSKSKPKRDEPLNVVLARVKGDLETIVDRGISFGKIEKSIVHKIKTYVEAISCM